MNIYLYLSIIFIFISIMMANYKSKNIWNVVFNSSMIFLYFILTILYFSADYFTNEGVNEVVIYTLEYGLGGAGFGEYALLLSLSILFFVIAFSVSYMYFRIVKNSFHPKPKKIKGLLHNIFLILAFSFHPLMLDLYHIYKIRYPAQSYDFKQYYTKPNLQNILKTKDLNLVYIYAESLEQTYFDETIFPGLLPNLKQLKNKSIEFTDINQVHGTGWTIGGITASQCSIPLFTVSSGNSLGNMNTFLSGAECLGDVLKTFSYHLVYLQGASTEFSGKNKFFSTHSFDEIYGREELKEKLTDKFYLNGWGLYDDVILNMSFEKFEELSFSDKKFALFTLTLDTHHPNGHPSRTCSDIPYKDGDNSILNAVHCSDFLISKFITKIQNSKYADKTLIILTSDHLAMKNTATDMLKKGKRKDLFLIFDPKNKKYIPIRESGSMFDVAPTVLHQLGLEIELGLGRNLFKSESLYTYFDDFNKKLLSWRHDILKLWEFPKVSEHYDINVTAHKVNIANNIYDFPVLFKINMKNEIEPIFEADSSKVFFQYMKNFSPEQKFIWIDKCKKINFLFEHNITDDFCIVQGNLAGNIEVIHLQKNVTDVNINHMLADTKVNMKKYYPILTKLEHISECQKPEKGNVSIVSSEHITSKTVASAIKTDNKSFGLSRGLNLLTIDQDGTFNIQKFDVYGSQIEANKFLTEIKPLIKYKKFWAVASHDAIKNIHTGYKEKLSELGFKLLPTLNGRVAYIAYQDISGALKEHSSETTLCQIIPSYIKP